MAAIEFLNEPIDIEIADCKLKIRRLSILGIIACAEKYCLEKRLNKIKAAASLLDGQERLTFFSGQVERMPNGQELEKEALAVFAERPHRLACMLMADGLKQDQPEITLDTVADLIDRGSPEDIRYAMDIISGGALSPRRKKSQRSRPGDIHQTKSGA